MSKKGSCERWWRRGGKGRDAAETDRGKQGFRQPRSQGSMFLKDKREVILQSFLVLSQWTKTLPFGCPCSETGPPSGEWTILKSQSTAAFPARCQVPFTCESLDGQQRTDLFLICGGLKGKRQSKQGGSGYQGRQVTHEGHFGEHIWRNTRILTHSSMTSSHAIMPPPRPQA